MTSIDKATLHRTGDGKSTSMMSAALTLKAENNDTGGAFSPFFEYETPPGFSGSPPHRHRKMVEGSYVLEGELTITLDEKTTTLAPGDFALEPASVVPSRTPARRRPSS